MGKPRLIILIRHAQSEGNKNRDIHQYTPDHRVALTSDGWTQAEEAGHKLKALLKKDDTIRIFTSPYRRTRETTEGILRTLTADNTDSTPSPFQREDIKVYEEPRLREQEFGGYQPCSVEVDRIAQERADYGHFFYRIPNGESAADAYDRISGFNESLWRQFGDEGFPSVCILVTHGLMTRVFLMKWYHWSVEYFEDLRNLHHCTPVIMERDEDTTKYVLRTPLRTWTELEERNGKANAPATAMPTRRWGGCSMGCNHRRIDADTPPVHKHPSRSSTVVVPEAEKEVEDVPVAETHTPNRSRSVKRFTSSKMLHDHETVPHTAKKPVDLKFADDSSADDDTDDVNSPVDTRHLRVSRDAVNDRSGLHSPGNISDNSDYFDLRAQSVTRTLARSDLSRSALSQLAEEDGEPGARRGSTPRAGSRSRPRKSSTGGASKGDASTVS